MPLVARVPYKLAGIVKELFVPEPDNFNIMKQVFSARLVGLLAVICLNVFLCCPSIRADLLTGTIVNYPESSLPPLLTIGDGVHSVSLDWSVSSPNSSGFFYRTSDTEVALASGVSDISQITDASIYSFTTIPGNFIGPLFDADSTGGLDSFIVLRSISDGYYGVIRLDDIFAYAEPMGISEAGLDATWWFQDDGTASFSSVPEPSTVALAFGCLSLLFIRRSRCR